MLRTVDVVMIGLLLGGAAFTFKVKHDSELAIERVQELEAQIKKERDAIDVLKADWALLTSPQRLELLAARYKDELFLSPVDPTQIGAVSDIPLRVQFPPVAVQKSIAGILEAEEGITTGSVRKDDEASQ